VLQQVRVEEVLMQEGRAVGVRATASGWRQDISSRFVVDASGRRCLLATQLGLKANDPEFSQFAIYSWFENVEPAPPGTEGMLFLHFLGLERAWAWQIPLRHGIWSVGFVTDRADFKKAGTSEDGFAAQLVQRNANLSHNLRDARRVRPWRTEGDYSYRISQVAGRGWLLVGDALRFVDPIFSTGVDVAAYSALHANEAIKAVLTGGDENAALASYEHTVGDGVEAWYELIRLFYRLQNLFTYFAVRRNTREEVVRILQGNLYDPLALARAREMIDLMQSAYARVTRDSNNLLRPGALTAG
jgi:FADH2 O2-dependent halogenase